MGKRILLIESDKLTQETLVLLLNQRGYETGINTSGKEVMKDIHSFKPDLILLDIVLGEVDGRDICKELKRNPVCRNIPVIVISASPDVYNSICEDGANDVILKPFNEQTLLNRITRQLQNSKGPILNQLN